MIVHDLAAWNMRAPDASDVEAAVRLNPSLQLSQVRRAHPAIGRHHGILSTEERTLTFPVLLEPGESGWIVAACPAPPGRLSQGRKEGEALTNIKDAIRSWLKVQTDKRQRLPGGKMVEVAL
jgi:predicted RNase H-like HicB family nuclease